MIVPPELSSIGCRPAGMRHEQEVFDELQSVCRSAGYIHVLAYFSWRDNFLTYPESGMRPEDLAKSYKPTRLFRTELTTLIGIMLKSEIDFSLPNPPQFQVLIESTDRLLEDLHEVFNQPMMKQIIKAASTGSRENPFKRADVLREPIFYGGESAYSFQYRDFALQKYCNDNAWLAKNKGFTIEQAHAFVKSISNYITKKR